MCNEWKETKEMLQYIDVIVDGKYEEDKKDMMLQFKGSSNQRTILVKESLNQVISYFCTINNIKEFTQCHRKLILRN